MLNVAAFSGKTQSPYIPGIIRLLLLYEQYFIIPFFTKIQSESWSLVIFGVNDKRNVLELPLGISVRSGDLGV